MSDQEDPAVRRPDILSLTRMMQQQKIREYDLGTDYDQEWDFFCVFCEILCRIVLNKMSCERPTQVQSFTSSYKNLKSDSDRVNIVLSDSDIKSILKYFVREVKNLPATKAKTKSDCEAAGYREAANIMFRDKKFLESAATYSQVHRVYSVDFGSLLAQNVFPNTYFAAPHNRCMIDNFEIGFKPAVQTASSIFSKTFFAIHPLRF